jgi:hypothetical protein
MLASLHVVRPTLLSENKRPFAIKRLHLLQKSTNFVPYLLTHKIQIFYYSLTSYIYTYYAQ